MPEYKTYKVRAVIELTVKGAAGYYEAVQVLEERLADVPDVKITELTAERT